MTFSTERMDRDEELLAEVVGRLRAGNKVTLTFCTEDEDARFRRSVYDSTIGVASGTGATIGATPGPMYRGPIGAVTGGITGAVIGVALGFIVRRWLADFLWEQVKGGGQAEQTGNRSGGQQVGTPINLASPPASSIAWSQGGRNADPG